LLLKHLLAHIASTAGGRIALTFIGVSSAVVIDVTLFFYLTDHRAAALGAGNQTGEGEIMLAALGLAGVAAVENALCNVKVAAEEQCGLVGGCKSLETHLLQLAQVDVT
jgi:hypothetical protein